MQATPSAGGFCLRRGGEGARCFKILCGGEILSRDWPSGYRSAAHFGTFTVPRRRRSGRRLKCRAGDGPVYIGRPIDNTRIYVLDAYFQPVPIGVHGDIYIGGDGFARGYLNRPELTTERFVAYPFNDQPDSLLYRTGDLARYRPGGNIEFLGRLDNQVKIRGYRIELGEIETILNQHPAVKDSVVVARARDSSGEKELVGYIVPKSGFGGFSK